MWAPGRAAGPLAGIVGDRCRRKTLILGGLVFWSLVTLATALSTAERVQFMRMLQRLVTANNALSRAPSEA